MKTDHEVAVIPDPTPVGYRLLDKGGITQYGDIGFMVWARGNKRAWTELRAGHVLNATIVRPGAAARKITT